MQQQLPPGKMAPSLIPHPPRERCSRKEFRLHRSSEKASTQATAKSSAMALADSGPKLSQIKAILDALFARNKNQHRSQTWWKNLSLLRRAVTRLDDLEDRERRLRSRTMSHLDANEVRANFD